ncbi:MAG: hypothetical protein MZV63_38965 [Marinilabiliales bacterium]|nr:hypothetical protein [Marinilabiliales bacterium]
MSAFDTAPLAPDLDFVMANTHGNHLQTGINALSRLTDGKIHISREAGSLRVPELDNLQKVEYPPVYRSPPCRQCGSADTSH